MAGLKFKSKSEIEDLLDGQLEALSSMKKIDSQEINLLTRRYVKEIRNMKEKGAIQQEEVGDLFKKVNKLREKVNIKPIINKRKVFPQKKQSKSEIVVEKKSQHRITMIQKYNQLVRDYKEIRENPDAFSEIELQKIIIALDPIIMELEKYPELIKYFKQANIIMQRIEKLIKEKLPTLKPKLDSDIQELRTKLNKNNLLFKKYRQIAQISKQYGEAITDLEEEAGLEELDKDEFEVLFQKLNEGINAFNERIESGEWIDEIEATKRLKSYIKDYMKSHSKKRVSNKNVQIFKSIINEISTLYISELSRISDPSIYISLESKLDNILYTVAKKLGKSSKKKDTVQKISDRFSQLRINRVEERAHKIVVITKIYAPLELIAEKKLATTKKTNEGEKEGLHLPLSIDAFLEPDRYLELIIPKALTTLSKDITLETKLFAIHKNVEEQIALSSKFVIPSELIKIIADMNESKLIKFDSEIPLSDKKISLFKKKIIKFFQDARDELARDIDEGNFNNLIKNINDSIISLNDDTKEISILARKLGRVFSESEWERITAITAQRRKTPKQHPFIIAKAFLDQNSFTYSRFVEFIPSVDKVFYLYPNYKYANVSKMVATAFKKSTYYYLLIRDILLKSKSYLLCVGFTEYGEIPYLILPSGNDDLIIIALAPSEALLKDFDLPQALVKELKDDAYEEVKQVISTAIKIKDLDEIESLSSNYLKRLKEVLEGYGIDLFKILEETDIFKMQSPIKRSVVSKLLEIPHTG